MHKVKIPQYRVHPGVVCLVCTICLTGLSVLSSSSDIYCIYYPDKPPRSHLSSLCGLYLFFVAPLYGTVFVAIAAYIGAAKKIRSYYSSGVTANTIPHDLKELTAVTYQMLAYGMVFAVGFLLSLSTIVVYLLPGQHNAITHALAPASAATLSLTGTGVAVQYLYFQGVLAYRCEHCLGMICIVVPLTSPPGRPHSPHGKSLMPVLELPHKIDHRRLVHRLSIK